MQQVKDFVAESEALNAVLVGLDGDGWARARAAAEIESCAQLLLP